MSETVHYKGTLIKIERENNETLEDLCKKELIKQGKNINSMPTYYKKFAEWLLDDNYEQFIIYKDELYQVDKKHVDVDEDIMIIKKIDNKTFEFEVKYYDGGCCFDEAIETAFDEYE